MRASHIPFLILTLAPIAFSGPAVTKTVLNNLPEKALFNAVAVKGKIYAFKFSNEDFKISGGEVYAYDVKTGQWTARAIAALKRSNPSLVQVDNRMFVIGGFSAPNTPTAAVEEYVPAKDSWIPRKDMPTPRARMGIVLLDGRIYALGGRIQDSRHTDAVEAYDPATDTWSQKQKLSSPGMGVNAAAAHGKIYKLKTTQIRDGRWTMLMDFEEFDPVTNLWTKKAPWTFEREPLEMTVIDGRLFVFGAGAFSKPDAHSLREYDFPSDRWLIRKDMPLATAAHTIHPGWAVLGGKIYVFGGGYREGNTWKHSNYAQRYNPRTDSWEELPPLTQGKLYMPAVAVGDRIFVLGGDTSAPGQPEDRPSYAGDVEVYTVHQ